MIHFNTDYNRIVKPLLLILLLLSSRFFAGVELFHTLVEFMTILVGIIMYIVVVNTRHFIKNDLLLFLGIGYLAIAVMDILHVLTIFNLPFFPISSIDVTLKFWLYARLLEAGILLCSCLFFTHKLNIPLMYLASIFIVCLGYFLGFHVETPVLYVEGQLSTIKIAIELLIVVILIAAGTIFFIKRRLIEKSVLRCTLLAIILTILAELSFTQYEHFNSGMFVIGHVLKFLSYWFLYQAIVRTTFPRPIKMLARGANSYDAIPHAAVRVDENADIAQLNRTALNCSQFSLDDLLHKPVHDFYHPINIASEDCKYCKAMKTHQMLRNEEVYFPQTQQWYLLSISPIEENQPKAGMVQTLTNITTQKNQEKELQQHKALLESRVKSRTKELEHSIIELKETQDKLVESKKLASLGGLVSGIAHEINTPVGIGITASSYLEELNQEFSQAVEDKVISRKVLNKYMSDAQQCTTLVASNLDRAAALIKDFKQLAYQPSFNDRKGFHFKQQIKDIIWSQRKQWLQEKIIISFDEKNDFEVTQSPDAFRQVIEVLVENSVMHGFKEKGDGEIFVHVSKKEDIVQLIYQDNGCGIPQEHLSKIYEPFYTTRRGGGASGLGLYMVYNTVMHSLKGKLECKSVVKEGTTFTITFPITV